MIRKKTLSILLIFILTFSVLCIFITKVYGLNLDLTTFTEEDEGDGYNHINVYSSSCVYTNMDRDVDAWLYYDYGENTITDYILEFRWNYTTTTVNAISVFACMSNYIDDVIYMYNNHIDTIFLLTYTSPLQFRIYEYYDGTNYNSVCFYPSIQTNYWIRVLRYGTSYSVEVYNDEDYSNLNSYKNLTLHSNYSFRYLMFINSYNTGSNGYNQPMYFNNPVFYGLPISEDVSTCNYLSTSYNTTSIINNCNFTALWSTNGTLSYYIFCWNFTGTFINDDTINFDSTTSNTTKFLGANATMIGYTITYNFTAYSDTGISNTTGLQNLILTYDYEYTESDLEDYFLLGIALTLLTSFALIIILYNDKKKKW